MDIAAKLGLILSIAIQGFSPAAIGTSEIKALLCNGATSAPSILAPVDGATTTSASTSVSGVAQAGATVRIYDNGTLQGTVTATPDASFDVNVPLVIGANQLIARADNGCGVSGDSNVVNITRQQVAPNAPSVASPANGTTTTESSVTVTGDAEPDSTVSITNDGQFAGSVVADSLGGFSLSVALHMGANGLVATASNGAGSSPPSATTTVNRTAPPVPTPGSPQSISGGGSNAPPPSGTAPVIVSPADGTSVSAGAITVSGKASPGATITLLRNGEVAAKLIADSSGRFSADVALNIGENRLQATSASGNSAIITVTRTPSAPIAPRITAPPDGSKTNVSRIRVSGVAEPGSTVNILINGVSKVEITADSNGLFSAEVELEIGKNLIVASSRNATGVSDSQSVLVNYSKSKLTPAVVGSTGVGVMGTIISGLAGMVGLVISALERVYEGVGPDPVDRGTFALLLTTLALLVHGFSGLGQLWLLLRGRSQAAYDSVSGKRLHLVRTFEKDGQTWATKPGYEPTLYREGVEMVPVQQYSSGLQQVLHELLELFGWGAIILGTGYGIFLLQADSILVGGAVTILFGGFAITQRLVGMWWAETRWGCVYGPGGEHAHEGKVEVFKAETGESLFKTNLTEDGHFAGWGEPGRYVVKASVNNTQLSEVVNLRRPGYITPKLRAPRT